MKRYLPRSFREPSESSATANFNFFFWLTPTLRQPSESSVVAKRELPHSFREPSESSAIVFLWKKCFAYVSSAFSTYPAKALFDYNIIVLSYYHSLLILLSLSFFPYPSLLPSLSTSHVILLSLYFFPYSSLGCIGLRIPYSATFRLRNAYGMLTDSLRKIFATVWEKMIIPWLKRAVDERICCNAVIYGSLYTLPISIIAKSSLRNLTESLRNLTESMRFRLLDLYIRKRITWIFSGTPPISMLFLYHN